MANFIDYQRIGRAINFYTKKGYVYVEAAWSVPRWASAVTCPDPENAMTDGTGNFLVGSAEQSFIAMMGEERLPPGKYVACTPCFRYGDSDGDLHQPMFMKVELIRTDEVDEESLQDILNDAAAFSFTELHDQQELYIDETDIGLDLILHDIEIGSYGIRQLNNGMEWVYGTGLAEPRFSMALSRP